jgi:DNA-binding GntR family transcriptional regulator
MVIMMFQELENMNQPSLTLQQREYRAIFKNRLEEKYPAESQLVTRQVADELKVSATPIREALQRLVKQGFISEYPRRGYFVKHFSPADIISLYDTREAVEPLAAFLTAKNAEPADIARLEELCSQWELLLSNSDHGSFNAFDEKFHQLLGEFSGNPYLERISQEAFTCHAGIVDHIKNHEPELARELMREHVKWSRNSVQKMLSEIEIH